ncbi:enoyl-CoA hydratase-related protein [Paractinoplanes ferrugineus]|uniref:3-hydroxybutyryl-CoA dehydratase n=1 Tax=Paractinoplanes ferrugineus TaxID=113564 RepID=A0A919J3S8_9ACTN|nr:enoyl-CoA hydratase/isomerase family protein [Actinoplanes ferrugineus]GIE13139.1 3-hydroxybutyryl-CoA dehydratase [Actinoplanes ferrugineus]
MPVTLDVDDRSVATLLLDRPRKRNALDREMLESLLDATGRLAGRTDVRAVVVRGAGGTFCAGADIGDWVAPSAPLAAELSKLGRDAFAAVAALDVPSVALIEGTAIGGGFELALACDLRIAAGDALIGFPELRLGNLPAWGGLARLIDVAGLGTARHLLLTGELIDGVRAAALGAVTAVAADGDLSAELSRVVDCFTACEPAALALAKQVLSGFDSDLPLEPAMASYTAGLDSSRRRKQDFLDRQAARKIGVSS